MRLLLMRRRFGITQSSSSVSASESAVSIAEIRAAFDRIVHFLVRLRRVQPKNDERFGGVIAKSRASFAARTLRSWLAPRSCSPSSMRSIASKDWATVPGRATRNEQAPRHDGAQHLADGVERNRTSTVDQSVKE